MPCNLGLTDKESRQLDSAVDAIYAAGGSSVELRVPVERSREEWYNLVAKRWNAKLLQMLQRRGNASDVRRWVAGV